MNLKLANGMAWDKVVNSEGRYAITRYIGGGSFKDGNLYPREFTISIHCLDLEPGQIIIICSDGVTDYINKSYYNDDLWKVTESLEKIIKENGEVIPFKVDNIAFNLLLNIRDEAHYFAISNHRKLRDKSRQNFTLENIKGIGKQKRQALLIRFGNIQNIKVATLEQLTSVKGISVELANNIINFFKANS